jgi:hypothetical protein
MFSKLDDYDIISAMKEWQYHDDFVLKNLCDMLINRDLLKIRIKNKKIKPENLSKHIDRLMEKYPISKTEAQYFVFQGKISNQAYTEENSNINILTREGKVKDVLKVSDQLNLKALSKPVVKYFICYPKDKL